MAILFEYYNQTEVKDPAELKKYLSEIWKSQFATLDEIDRASLLYEAESINHSLYQPFFKFDGHLIKANNYVGFIQVEDTIIEIYPKVFRHKSPEPILMLKHLFFWFDYCRKWKFPFTKENLDGLSDVEFPELIINIMASKMLEVVSSQPLSLYQMVDEPLYSPKGRINFKKYISSNFVNGNHHAIDCDYEPFLFDNRLNRTIKYVSRLLLNLTKFYENQSILQELIFILDDVKDEPSNYSDLDNIVLNPLFNNYSEVKDICKIVLRQMLYTNQKYSLQHWCLLLPMEYLFEDFIAGFVEQKFSMRWKVEYQKSNLNLSVTPAAFQMQHDILLTSKKDPNKQIIIDTKYKLRARDFKADKKKGIAQSDMYQMTSYALRRGCNNVLILYPNIDEKMNEPDQFVIQSGFVKSDQIKIVAAEIPFWSISKFEALSITLETVIKGLLEKYE